MYEYQTVKARFGRCKFHACLPCAAAGEKVACSKQLVTKGRKIESSESCRCNGIEREKVRNSNATSYVVEGPDILGGPAINR